MDKAIKVLIVDDSAYNRRTLFRILESASGVKVVGTGVDGAEGIKKALKLKPDVITLDLEMPSMDGFSFLRILMEIQPTPVIVVSARQGDTNVFKALELGAMDFLAKPTTKISPELYNIKNDLIQKVMAVSQIKLKNLQKSTSDFSQVIEKKEQSPVPKSQPKSRDIAKMDLKLVAIGSSTGGPAALNKIFSSLPRELPAGIVVSQHMPSGFTKAFAERLNKCSQLRVKEAERGEPVERGKGMIAPGGYNIFLERKGRSIVVGLKKRGARDKYVPSINLMFRSAAELFRENNLGVILTGMGDDGKEGISAIKENEGKVFAESADSSVIFGMPKEAIKTGVVDKILPLSKIPEEIVKWSNG
ncbi:MAG: chemotaxis response regulator protein-glutamate methylesterase [Deltaproteobacteria bacterium]|nr:MAG: chemotaxis response regulator protein-glutamate methylesterase [Deltaproteobacteria bacterium]